MVVHNLTNAADHLGHMVVGEVVQEWYGHRVTRAAHGVAKKNTGQSRDSMVEA